MRRPVITLSQFVLALSLCHAVGAQGGWRRLGRRANILARRRFGRDRA